jgi:hypothetical protein
MDFVGIALFALGVLLVAIRKPLGTRMRARWILHDRARLRMEQIKGVGEMQSAFARRIEARQSELAAWRKERFQRSQTRLALRNILADAQSGDALLRALPGSGRLFGVKVVSETAAAAIERGLQPQNLDASWAAPQAVFVRAGSEDGARQAVQGAYPEALGYQVLAVREFDVHPVNRVYDDRKRMVAAPPEVVGARAPTGAVP